MIICFSGVDGCGKGTQKDLLTIALRAKGKSVFSSKAYGDGEKECFAPFIEYWSQEAILFLFQALHVEQRKHMEKALQRGEIVIADRWDESYLAYHRTYGILKDDPTLRNLLNAIVFKGIIPDITFLLDVPVEQTRKRLQLRGADFFDKLPETYHETMRKEYLRLAEERKWIVLDGTRPAIEIHKNILDTVLAAIV